MSVLGAILVFVFTFVRVDSYSRIPSEFSNSTWYSNVHGDILFTYTEMQNWAAIVNGESTVNWIIEDDTRYTVTGGYIIFRSANNYTINGTNYYAFMCTYFNRLSENLYNYYSLHGTESRFGGERVVLWEAPCVERFELICDLKFLPNNDNINILARKGAEQFTTCPEQLTSGIGFTVQTTNTTDLCVGVGNTLDGCLDNTKIQINSACSYPLVFSTNGSLSCLTVQASGADGIVYLLNMDTAVDNVNTYRFSCMAIASDGTIMSIVPRQCLSGHSSTSFPTSTSTLGQRLFVKTRAVCARTVVDIYDETRALWIRIGIPVALALLFFAIFLTCAILACRRVRRDQMTSSAKKQDRKKSPKIPDDRQIVVYTMEKPKKQGITINPVYSIEGPEKKKP